MAALRAIERIVVRTRSLCAVVSVSGKVVATHDFRRWKGAFLDTRRIVFRVICHVAAPAEHRVVVVDAGVDNADANPFASGREIATIPNIRPSDERNTRRGQRSELRDRLDIDHTVESPKSLHLAKRKPYLDRVGQAAEPRLDRPADLAKPCHDRVLLGCNFGNTTAGSLGNFAIGQAPIE